VSNLMVLRRNNAVEDVEILTWRNQAVKRMRENYKNILSAEERRARRQERKRAQRKVIRVCCGALVVAMSAFMGLYLAMGDLVSCCACIVICLLAITAIAMNGEYDNGK